MKIDYKFVNRFCEDPRDMFDMILTAQSFNALYAQLCKEIFFSMSPHLFTKKKYERKKEKLHRKLKKAWMDIREIGFNSQNEWSKFID